MGNEVSTVRADAEAIAFARSYVFDAPYDTMVAAKAAGFGGVSPVDARSLRNRPDIAMMVRQAMGLRRQEQADAIIERLAADAVDVSAAAKDRTNAAKVFLLEHRAAEAAKVYSRPLSSGDKADKPGDLHNATQATASVSEVAAALLSAIEDGGTTLRAIKATTLPATP